MNTHETKALIQEVIRNLRCSEPCPHFAIRILGGLHVENTRTDSHVQWESVEHKSEHCTLTVHTPRVLRVQVGISREETVHFLALALVGPLYENETEVLRTWVDILEGEENWEDPNDDNLWHRQWESHEFGAN